MGRAYSFEIRDRAEELYIQQGLTLEQVAVTTGVSIPQVKTWSINDNWVARREEYRGSLHEIRSNTILLRKGLIQKALSNLDPQSVYAAASFERLAQLAEKQAALGAPPVAPEYPEEIAREITTPQQAIDALQEAAQSKLNGMLSRPGDLTLKSLKDVQSVLQLINDLRTKYTPEDKTAAVKGLSDEAAEEIRQKILGIQVTK